MAHNAIRFGRLTRPSGAMLMVPLDHGISMGPVPGISPPGPTMAAVAPHATCFTLHKGLVRHAAEHARDTGILLHLSASTDLAPDPHDKRLVATVAEAVRLGCDGVSTHLNLGSRTEADQIAAVGAVSTACQEYGMPHVAMVYPRGPAIKNPFAAPLVAHAARLAAELGADVAKVPFTGSAATFRDVVTGAGIPVIVAGGPRADDVPTLLIMLRAARRAGAAGVSVGRNVFQADDPGAVMRDIAKLFP